MALGAPSRTFRLRVLPKVLLRNAATRVTTAAEMRGRARLIAASCAHARIPVRSILDAGCGIGLLRKPFAAEFPRARYSGSRAAIISAPGTAGSRVPWSISRRAIPSDLVVCYDVLQYLDDREAARAIANLAETDPRRRLRVRADARGLARELRPQPHRPRPCTCGAGIGIAGACAGASTTWASASGCART